MFQLEKVVEKTLNTTKLKPRATLNISQFRVDVNLADLHACGGAQGKFTTSIKITTRGLTEEGFVIEVQSVIAEVRGRFDHGRTMFKASCEALACGVLRVVYDMLGDRLEQCEVTVLNLTGSVLLEWTKDEEVPQFPPKATRREQIETEERRKSEETARTC